MAALPVESSWRMVDGDNDSFDTSIVPNAVGLSDSFDGHDTQEDDPFVSGSGAPSQQSADVRDIRRGLGTRTVSGVSGASRAAASSSQDSFSGSIGGSQDDDIHSFLRKAENGENDERVLLRSPFQPSLPSSVRQSPLDASKTTKTKASRMQTPEPEFRMPTIGMDGSIHADGARPLPRAPGVSSSFHVSDTGSPALRRRMGGGLLSRLGQIQHLSQNSVADEPSDAARVHAAAALTRAAWTRAVHATRAWLFFFLVALLGLAAAYGAPSFSPGVYTTAVRAVCSVPGVSVVGLPFCPPSPKADVPLRESDGTPTPDADADADTGYYWDVRNRFTYEDQQAALLEHGKPSTPVVSIVRGAGDLMRAQTQLAAIVRQHIVPGRGGTASLHKVPPPQDAWLVPRTQTKELRMAAQIQQGKATQTKQAKHTGTLLVVELDAYLEAAKQVSITLTRLQTGAAAVAADTLAYRSRQTLAQLRRMAAAVTRADKPGETGWLARFVWGSSSIASASRRRELLQDAYRHHTDAVLAKTQLRVDEAETVLKALERASRYLTGVQSYVAARRDELRGRKEEAAKVASTASTGGGPGGDPMLDTSGGLFSWLWSKFKSEPPLQSASSTSPSRMSKAGREWTGYADRLQRLRDDHDAAVTRAIDTLDELAAVRDALRSLQLQFTSDGSDSSDSDDLDLWLHMDIVDAGIQDLEKTGLR